MPTDDELSKQQRAAARHSQFLLNELSVNSLLTPAAACAAAAQPVRGTMPEYVTKKPSSSPPISLEAAAEASLQSSLLEEEESIMKDSERNDRKKLVVDLCHFRREKICSTRVKVMQKGHTNANEEEEGPLPKFTTIFSPTSLAYTSELNILLPPTALPFTATFTMQRLSRNPSNTLAPVDKERGREVEEERQQWQGQEIHLRRMHQQSLEGRSRSGGQPGQERKKLEAESRQQRVNLLQQQQRQARAAAAAADTHFCRSSSSKKEDNNT